MRFSWWSDRLAPRPSAPYKLHLGCNETRLEGFFNVDARKTEAADLVHSCKDLSPFGEGEASLIFSNAFFEHLYRVERAPLLRDAARVLAPGGLLLFTGVPDFEAVARAYLERRPGNGAPIFDLGQVYRYTHGEPEQVPAWWLEQLHKTLFDAGVVETLLAEAGFGDWHVFRYAWGDEPNAVNLGFATEKPGGKVHDRASIGRELEALRGATNMNTASLEVLRSTY
jgi:predicted SAM-dependent methyltransferase